jgi:ElaB/YqjD/DUF883 family membrane-anchored ribosome-binding protein
MLHSNELRDELQTLKRDVSRLLTATGEGILDASKNRAEALADQIKAALNDLGETLGQEEDRIGDILSDRPIATLASAFALGVVVGFMLRRG